MVTSLPRGSAAWQRLSLAIRARDGWRCQVPLGDVGICGRPATCTDHIVARSQGGSDDPSNLRACCTAHNLAKWDQAILLPRARTSRAWL